MPTLPDELLEEIFLRFPPDEPACLVRASLASKLWLGILTGARFRGLYRDHHGAPPMLGFIYSCHKDDHDVPDETLPHFVSTAAKFSVRIPAAEDWRGCHKDYAAWDCRHGRVLFCKTDVVPLPLVVWDPMTGSRTLMYAPHDYDSFGAAVVCNAAGCDHRPCHAGPFQVVFVGLYNNADGCVAYAHVSLPDMGDWSEWCPALDLVTKNTLVLDGIPPVYVQDALHFMLTCEYQDGHDHNKIAILKYDLGCSCLSLIDVPPAKTGLASRNILMAMEDGSLGFACIDGSTLNLWSRQNSSNGVMAWTHRRFNILRTLLPNQSPMLQLRLIGSLEYNDIIFATNGLSIYEINLKSLRWKKIWNRKQCFALFPYMSFYNPPERGSLSDAAHRKCMVEFARPEATLVNKKDDQLGGDKNLIVDHVTISNWIRKMVLAFSCIIVGFISVSLVSFIVLLPCVSG